MIIAVRFGIFNDLGHKQQQPEDNFWLVVKPVMNFGKSAHDELTAD
jgi:hypothetical protein